jgi:hypothetical protein
MAGPLADWVLEPAVGTDGWTSVGLGLILGTEPGSGMALLYVSCALAMVCVGCSGFLAPALNRLESMR